MSTKQKICIVGGGFGGLYTALRLHELPTEVEEKPEITLIDKGDRFLFSPLLYELITEELQSWEIAPPFEEVLANTGIVFRQGEVTNIDLEAKQVTVDNSSTIDYDKLVLSTGGKTPLNIVPGAIANAIPFRSLKDAYRIIEKLRHLEESHQDIIRVAIVGAGYSGVELACKVADRLGDQGRVRIIDRGTQILDNATDFNREKALTALEERQIWIDLETEVAKVEADEIALTFKGEVDTIPVDLVLWTVGNQVSTLTEKLNLEKSDRGLLKLQNTLQVLNNDDVYALGDIAECQDEHGNILPATAQVAFQQSDYCAWNIWAQINHKPLLPFRYQALGEMMALGADNAALSGLGLQLDGSLAYIARRLIYLYRLPTLKHQLTVGLNWITQPIVELLS
ncbi:NADH dehydrogenase, FAD-containing subunit [Xenococcus sp. PCC 7305]|uniref:NAD(P)/FAD-dependent oxidoreductase n=1 Tax=Xenococcus sp. PCC 7305 TaxID=102125 RepID=UPI0002AC0094|nr:NAD(P)/FAD-dependent oxidoreductase [Xenococcus sp. PCC 7305]ELS03980.1 NADH dehydrogenase, FAD-containing subunit [Xenococcus sp. PCC 7305]